MATLDDTSETARLLKLISSGDREAFGKLFERHREELRAAVQRRLDTRLRARIDPSDVLQETQLEAFQRLENYLERRPMPVRLWLRKTAHERLIKLREQHLKAARRSVAREEYLPDLTSAELTRRVLRIATSPSQHIIEQEQLQRVRAALSELAEADQEILVMRYLEQLTTGEIAQILDISPAAVSKRHGRALLRLRSRLRGEHSEES